MIVALERRHVAKHAQRPPRALDAFRPHDLLFDDRRELDADEQRAVLLAAGAHAAREQAPSVEQERGFRLASLAPARFALGHRVVPPWSFGSHGPSTPHVWPDLRLRTASSSIANAGTLMCCAVSQSRPHSAASAVNLTR
jgi:hypothetical protein